MKILSNLEKPLSYQFNNIFHNEFRKVHSNKITDQSYWYNTREQHKNVHNNYLHYNSECQSFHRLWKQAITKDGMLEKCKGITFIDINRQIFLPFI